MTDPRHDDSFDYSHLRDDLVHVEVLLPPNVPGDFREPAVLAHALDMAEIRKIRTPLSERIRQPQGVMSVIIALPPETEVSLAEAVTIAKRIVLSSCGSHPVAIHIAIHEALLNRHAHAAIGFRSMNPDGTLGLKIKDLFVRFSVYGAKAKVSEGTGWPDISWEVQTTLFLERAIDLVVDPVAPVPEQHLDVDFHDEDTRRRVIIQREAMRHANVEAIQGSPTHLIEVMLRGRSSLQVAELHRLCARFIDNEGDRDAEVDRILRDQNIITLAEAAEAQKPRFATTRRTARLFERASKLIDGSGGELIAVTGHNHDAVVAQLADLFAAQDEPHTPLILGGSLSDCSATVDALIDRRPIVGTLDMAVTGDPDQRRNGRKKGVRMNPGQIVIVPRAELIDDTRLARLLIAADCVGSKLLLGHDQSRQTGVVCRHLAAYIVDQPLAEPAAPRDAVDPRAIERLLRSGLVRHAIEAMVELGILHFSKNPDCYLDDRLPFAVIDDPRHVDGISNTIRMDRLQAGLIERQETLAGPRVDMELSLGEWIVTTKKRGLPETIGAHQLAQIVAIDTSDNWIDVVRSGAVTRLDLENDPAIRPAAAVSIRDAWDAPPDASLVIELTDPRRAWSALLLAATRIESSQVYIAPSIARNLAELVEAARRSLPAAPPSHWFIRRDDDAVISKIFEDFFDLPKPAVTEPEPPAPIGFAEDVRHTVSKKLAYRLLHRHVARDNPDHEQNVQRLLGLCSSELTKAIILFLAQKDAAPEADEADLPSELMELEPRPWTPREKAGFKLDLKMMNVRAFGWGLLPPIATGRPSPLASMDLNHNNSHAGAATHDVPSTGQSGEPSA